MATVPIPLPAAAPVVIRRRATRGYAQIPNAICENQSLFTHSELAFLLVMFRRGNGGETVISDKNWETWTGLKDRQKHYAIAGLKGKGLEFEGKGDTAVYRFAWKQFGEFLRTAKPDQSRPRTSGRAVVAPAGFKAHKDCVLNGCAKMCEFDVVQPVAQVIPIGRPTGGDRGAANGQAKGGDLVQPVAQTGISYPDSLAWIQGRFPRAGIELLRGLAHSVEPPCDDAELLAALKLATKKRQESEGLYTLTVPPVVASLRVQSRPKPVRRVDVNAAVAGLHEFAQNDPRFEDVVGSVVTDLRKMDLNVTPDELSSKLIGIEGPLKKRLLEVAMLDAKFAKSVESLKVCAATIGLSDVQQAQHVESLSSIDAELLLNAPSLWGLLLR